MQGQTPHTGLCYEVYVAYVAYVIYVIYVAYVTDSSVKIPNRSAKL